MGGARVRVGGAGGLNAQIPEVRGRTGATSASANVFAEQKEWQIVI